MTLGEAIKAARDIKNMRRKDLADKLGITDKRMADIESNKAKPTKEDIRKVVEYTGVLIQNVGVEGKNEYRIAHVGDADAPEDPEQDEPKKIIRAGHCVYCGQQKLIETDEDTSGDELDKQATWDCTCEIAKAARRKREEEEQKERERQRKIDNAIFDINNLISDSGHSEAAMIMCKAVSALVDGAIRKVTITIDSRTTATILCTATGKIQTERREVLVDSAEIE